MDWCDRNQGSAVTRISTREGVWMMMAAKRIMVCSILIMLFLVPGCSEQEEEAVSFTATVLEVQQSSFLVEPAEGSAELRSADRIVAYVSDATITDTEGYEVDVNAVKAGSKVVIYYDGVIAESYPAQIWSIRVQVTD